MKVGAAFILFAVVLVMCAMAHADPVTLIWAASIQNIDGTPLTDLAGYKVHEGATVLASVGPTVLTASPDLPAGTHSLTVTAFKATGEESVPTNPVIATVAAAPPMATADTKAYELRSATLPLALIGLVPMGIPCGPETQIRNSVKYCRVPKSAVDVVVWPQNLAGVDFWVRAQ